MGIKRLQTDDTLDPFLKVSLDISNVTLGSISWDEIESQRVDINFIAHNPTPYYILHWENNQWRISLKLFGASTAIQVKI